jgi:hypothetical protein
MIRGKEAREGSMRCAGFVQKSCRFLLCWVSLPLFFFFFAQTRRQTGKAAGSRQQQAAAGSRLHPMDVLQPCNGIMHILHASLDRKQWMWTRAHCQPPLLKLRFDAIARAIRAMRTLQLIVVARNGANASPNAPRIDTASSASQPSPVVAGWAGARDVRRHAEPCPSLPNPRVLQHGLGT